MTIYRLKIIALLSMVLDHIAEYFPEAMPIELRWIGRLAAPIFIFCVIEGLLHTSNRKKYLLCLYTGSALMGIGSIILNLLFQKASVPITNNVFPTLFIIAALITGFEYAEQIRQKIFFCFIFTIVQIAILVFESFIITCFFKNEPVLVQTAYYCGIGGILPNIIFCDGSFLWIILGILMYRLREKKMKFIIMYMLFSVIQTLFTLSYGINVQNFLFINYQWMMLAALPLILLYNGKRGKNVKRFFYVFYPLHIWVIFILSNMIEM